jgi:hypothetical protein
MKLYRTTDRISVEIDGAIFKFAPLTQAQKSEIVMLGSKDALASIKLAVKYGLKDLIGAEDSEGNEYKLKFDDNGMLLDECVDDIHNPEDIEVSQKISHTCMNFINGIPKKIINYQNGEEVKGVKILHPTLKAKNKK